jgi:hypothetical protein
MKRLALLLTFGGVMLALAAGVALASPAAARSPAGVHSQAVPVKLLADLECAPVRGAEATFTIRNIGKRPLTLIDFHLELTKVVAGGQQGVGVLFVFPAEPRIAPGEEQKFLLEIGTPFEDDPGVDLSDARRLILGAEVFFVERTRPAVVRHFSFPGCGS